MYINIFYGKIIVIQTMILNIAIDINLIFFLIEKKEKESFPFMNLCFKIKVFY